MIILWMSREKLSAENGCFAVSISYMTRRDRGGRRGGGRPARRLRHLGRGRSAEREANIAERNKSVEGRAQKFQNELDRITASMADQLLPALEDLAPAMLAVMRAFTGVTTWVSKHLASSIEIAFGLAIARAGLESVLRNVIDSRSVIWCINPGNPCQHCKQHAGIG